MLILLRILLKNDQCNHILKNKVLIVFNCLNIKYLCDVCSDFKIRNEDALITLLSEGKDILIYYLQVCLGCIVAYINQSSEVLNELLRNV